MRWQQLFADLGAQFEQAQADAERSESGSRARAEVGGVLLVDRLRGAVGADVVLHVRGAGRVSGAVLDVGPDWVLLDGRGDVLVAARAITSVSGLGRRTGVPAGPGLVRARLDLRRALRALARDRATVKVLLDDATVLGVTVDRVGAEYL